MRRGFKLYNNGVICKRFYPEDDIPDGWELGQIINREAREEGNRKRRETNLKRYGVEHPSQLEEIRKKAERTNMMRYGAKAPSMSDCIKKKAEETCLKRYGYKSSAMSPEVKKKAEETCLKRYGYKSSAMNLEIKEKARQTCQERYGEVAPTKSKEIQDKVKKSVQKSLGVDYPMQSKSVREKSKKTCLDKYGVNYVSQVEEFRDKVEQTCIERYGTYTPFMSQEIKDKIKKTFIEKYGVDNPSKSEVVKEKRRQTNLDRFGVSCTFASDEVKEKARQTCQEKYGVPWACMRPEAKLGYSNDSTCNREFEDFLSDIGIDYTREHPISRFSYDFKVGNILIEIDPYATHNSLWGIFGDDKGKSEDYHYNKSHVAEENGYHCIHIFDWDDPEKIVKCLLTDKPRIYARNTGVFGIEISEAREYLNEYHIQGSCNGQKLCLGLRDVYGNLVSLMTFGKPRYNKNYEWELLRYCSSHNVVGGAEKLFSYFKKNYNPKSIISYCDRSKFRGDVYKKLGFTLLNAGKPSKHWYGMKDGRHITDNLLRQRGFDQLFGTNYGKGTSNEELIINEGYVPIYDCGQDTYIWEMKN